MPQDKDKKRVVREINDAADEARNEAREAATRLRSIAQSAGSEIKSFLSDKQEKIEDGYREVRGRAESTIKNKPFASAAVLVAAGAFLGVLFGRRS